MQTPKILQAVVLLMIVAMAASCAATKQYTSKIFPGSQIIEKDTLAVALRFLELYGVNPNKEDWVTTDIIMGRDTISNTLALDNQAKVYPAKTAIKDSLKKNSDTKNIIASSPKNTTESQTEEPIAKAINQNGVREKRTRDD